MGPIALEQPRGTLLHAWAKGLNIARQREPWLVETQRMLMELLPHRWWATYANQWLAIQLESCGRQWLESLVFVAGSVCRPVGERSGYPALTPSSGFTLSTEHLIGANLLEDVDETQPLKDL